MSFFIQLNTKYDIMKNAGNQSTVAIGFHNIEKEILWKSMATVDCLVANILQNIFFCPQQNTETHTGLEQCEVSK